MKEIKNYGKENQIIRTLAGDYQTFIQQTGKVPEELKEKLETAMKKCIFEPKLAKRLSFLESKTVNTPEEIEEMKVLREQEKPYFDRFCATTLSEDIQAAIGENNTISLVRREKIRVVNGKKISLDMNYLPKEIQFLQDPLNNAGKSDIKIPTSVFRLQLKEDLAEVTEEKMIIIGFLSLCFDPYKGYYETHHWKVSFKVVPKEKVIETNENYLDDEDLG